MIVTYSGANVMYLGTGKDQEIFKFGPGKNNVTPEQWKGIQAGIAARDKLRPGVQDHYDHCLTVIGGKEQESGLIIGPDEIDFLALHYQQAIKLVKGTVEMKQLLEYQALEDGSNKPRNSVSKAIKAQIHEVQAFHKNIADNKE